MINPSFRSANLIWDHADILGMQLVPTMLALSDSLNEEQRECPHEESWATNPRRCVRCDKELPC